MSALKLAPDKEWVFPGAAQISHRDKLPMRGMQLRHTYRNMLAEAQVSELFSHLLMGHRMPNMNSAPPVQASEKHRRRSACGLSSCLGLNYGATAHCPILCAKL
jgi:hypothetical protein